MPAAAHAVLVLYGRARVSVVAVSGISGLHARQRRLLGEEVGAVGKLGVDRDAPLAEFAFLGRPSGDDYLT
ncbi:MAG TPA: hypothetical protein VKB53_11055, partial [Gammaproteobacteria bacterium]|nr:hypothetical protein [Gammaproteobacteria bacterium]